MADADDTPADDEAGSPAERHAAWPADRRKRWLDALSPAQRRQLLWGWHWWARPAQLAPPGDWRTWLVMAGRGFGKTRAGAEWVRGHAEADGRLRVAIVGTTLAEARAVMVEGPSGLLAIGPPERRPRFEASLRRLTWPSGAVGHLYSATEAEALRGPQHHLAWADEIGKWPAGDQAWDLLAMGLRLGDRPRAVATTTPRATPLVRGLVEREGGGVAVTRGRTADNRAALAAGFLADMAERYGGTAFGRQELDGELILAVPGALWTRDGLDRCRGALPPRGEWARVVVGVDPPAGVGADACGVVVAMRDRAGRGHVLADASVHGANPEGWARAVAAAAAAWNADRVVAEANNGGAMVASVLRAANAALPLRLVHATHGKAARAEPVALLYQAGRVAHVGAFPDLEDELCGLVLGGDYQGPRRSPDRADALVWALTELLLGPPSGQPTVRRL